MAMINKNGNYPGRATEIQLTESGQKGTPGVQINFKVTKGEFEGSFVRYDGWFSDHVMKDGRTVSEMVIGNVYTCGWDDSSDPGNLDMFSDGGLHGVDTNDVELVVQMEEYQGDNENYKGKSFPRVAFINKAGGRGLNVEQAMTRDKSASLGEKMRGLAMKSRLKVAGAKADTGTDFNFGANAQPPPAAAAGGKRF